MLGPMRAQGTGSVYKRADGKWIAQVSLGAESPRRYIRRTRATKKAAGAALDELRKMTVRGPLTTGDFLTSWVAETRDIRATTRRGYASVVEIHLAPAIGRVSLAALSPADVESTLAALGPKLSPKSLRNAHAILRRALQQAVRAGLVDRNVAAREFVDPPKVPDIEPRSLTRAEVDRLLAVLAGDRIEALVITALGTGLRQGELLGLAWEDIGPDAITVRSELVNLGAGKYRREAPKTERSRRRVPLSPLVRQTLDTHRERLRAEGFATIATGPVFVNHRGKVLSGSWVTHHFYELLRQAGVERIPFKNLRTTFSTRLLEAGVADITIAALMGHARTATQKKHYQSVSPELVADAMTRVVG